MSKENRIVLVENTPGRTARLVSRVASIPLPKTQITQGRVHEFRECKGGPTENPTADHCSRGSGPSGETLWALGQRTSASGAPRSPENPSEMPFFGNSVHLQQHAKLAIARR